MTGKVFFYVQHLLGIGHVMRASALTDAMLRCGLDVCVVLGGTPVQGADFSGARIVQLPPLRARDSQFSGLVRAEGQTPDAAFLDRRRELLLEYFRREAPGLLLLETFPFGRRQMRFELLPLLDACRTVTPRPVLVCSVRDIVQRQRRTGRVDETLRLLNTFFDHVLVHGDPTLITLGESFERIGEITPSIHHTGYAVRPAGPRPAGKTGGVLVSSGGGEVGYALLRAALAARPMSRAATLPWRVLVGHGQPAGVLQALREGMPENVTVERNRADFRRLLAACGLSISQAGYNTVAEVLTAGVRALLVPFEGVGETEQLQRARRLAERGTLRMVREGGLDPGDLARAIDLALSDAGDADTLPDLDGARTSAALIAGWVRP